MLAALTQQLRSQLSLLGALFVATLIHLLLAGLAWYYVPAPPINLEQAFAQATQVVLEVAPLTEPEPPPSTPEIVPPVTADPPTLDAATKNKPVTSSAPPLASATPRPQLGASLLARSLEIARLEAELVEQQAAAARNSQVRRLSSGTPMSSEEALYLKQWEQKVERIGNLNYPEAAREQNLGGRLRLLVIINTDGNLLEAQLLTSSGHRVLDEAAIRILNLAAPFAPLPPAITAQAEVLEIIRTWRFGDGWYAN